MNYTEIKTSSLSYADREDAEVINNIDTFLRVVEARVNKVLRVQPQFNRASIIMSDKEYYGLPYDWAGLRDIQVGNVTPKYVSPEVMNNSAERNSSSLVYAIIANQIQIRPPVPGESMEIVYAQRVPPLSSTNVVNWLSKSFPDIYIFGLLVEISAFVKDAESEMFWDGRFKDELSNIKTRDDLDRWSGAPLSITVV